MHSGAAFTDPHLCDAGIPAITHALLELGFQRQVPAAFSGQPVEPSQTQAFIRPPQRRPAAAMPVAATLLGPQRTG